MRWTGLALVGLLAVGAVGVQAEDVYVLRECQSFKTKTTEVDRLRLPDLPVKGEDANRFGAGIELKGEWLTDRDFRDEQGRTWYLYRGAQIKGSEKLGGWIVKSDAGLEYFYSKEGRLYGREAKVPICSPCPTKVTNVVVPRP